MKTGSNRRKIIHNFEKQYQSSLHRTELLYREEEARLSRLHTLTLRDDAATLNDELTKRDAQIEILTQLGDKIFLELESQRGKNDNTEGQLNRQALDLANLRTEVELLTTATEDSNRILQEKCALSRELDRLRPEMEYLKSQLIDYQSFVAQNHALQRRMSHLETELENERRANQQTREREVDSLTNELRLRLEEAENKTAIDRKERDEMKSDYERGLSETLGLTEGLKKQISALNSKLKDVQSELQDTRVELESCRAKLREAQPESRDIQKRKRSAIVSRSALHLGDRIRTEIAIQTPSKDESMMKAARKHAAEQTFVGGKSAFSVTPFLNRTKSSLEDSVEESLPTEDVEPNFNKALVAGSPSPRTVGNDAILLASGEPQTTALSQKPRGRVKANISSKAAFLGEQRLSSMTKQNLGQKPDALDMVTEESYQDELGNKNESLAPHVPSLGKVVHGREIALNGKRKRKLFSANKGISEEEEDETVQSSVKIRIGPPRKLKAPLKGKGSAFATTTKAFSPLKRDRRGVNASFLA